MYKGQRLDAIDTRLVFKVYATVAGLTGLFITLWGDPWFGGDLAEQPNGQSALMRSFGSMIVAMACCAMGFAGVDDRVARRRSLFWFAIGHGFVWAILFSQEYAIWGPGLALRIVQVLGIVVAGLVHLWKTSEGDHAGGRAHSQEQFEQQIRQAVRLEERHRLARDLHDSVKQQIFAIQTAAATAEARFERDQTGAMQAVDQIRTSAREAMTEMQAMLDQLRAEPLENAGLIEAVRKQCEALEFRTGAKVEFTFGKLPPSETLPPGAHQAILRVTQEALANVGRHARASKVIVRLNSSRELVALKIQDDGAGFDSSQKGSGLGIANMHARAEEFGGKLELTSRPGGGTAVALSIPYARVETAREYRRNALAFGAALAIGMLAVIWTEQYYMAIICIYLGISSTRYAIAYRAARTREVAQ